MDRDCSSMTFTKIPANKRTLLDGQMPPQTKSSVDSRRSQSVITGVQLAFCFHQQTRIILHNVQNVQAIDSSASRTIDYTTGKANISYGPVSGVKIFKFPSPFKRKVTHMLTFLGW